MRYLFVLLLAGCSTVWTQPGTSEADFKRDAYECERDAAPVRNGFQAMGMQERCMESKGWRKK